MKNFLMLAISFVLLLACGNTNCPKCLGDGQIEEEYYITENYEEPVEVTINEDCSRCNGQGKLVCTYQFTNSGLLSSTTYECEGGKYSPLTVAGVNTGQLSGRKCRQCGGNGYLTCESCNGTGTFSRTKTKMEQKTRRIQKTRVVTDSYCNGTGEVSKSSEMFK